LKRQPEPLRYYEEVLLPRKIALAKQYVREHSTLGDLAIIARTALVVLKG
jgi:lipopolysaccharide/colanic/teichoic acid biosynthesis glycosyltransferase